MKSNPRDRTHNARTVKATIAKTEQNVESAEALLADTADPALRRELTEENERREQALDGLHQSVRDNARHHRPGD